MKEEERIRRRKKVITKAKIKEKSEKRSYRFLFLFSFFIFFSSFAYPQTAERIERLLETSAVSYEDAASFVLEAADVLAAPRPAAAFSYAAGQGWFPKSATADGAARLDEVSLIVMRAFNIKGGLFYSVAKNPHYAYRELVYLNVIQGRNDPAMAVSGDLLLFMINRVLSYQEANRL